ncbi:unnamed protein product [Brachionus calyciflorus]|uniref:Reverse transcriptase RNase H-like domain-containing protein n=1 Tax=Brachionus calyciflorus TaxID=104777 RepID=A0A814DCN4_9BILA|nr:unnamed protein product [Brachionus calyciflorus]
MCDSGADKTIINLNTFYLIKRHDPDTVMRSYNGNSLFSCTNEINIIGAVYLRRCLIDPHTNLENTMLIVTENISGYDCFLGRDIISKVPVLYKQLNLVQATIRELSSEIKRIFDQEMQLRRNKRNFRKNLIKNSHCGSELYEHNQIIQKLDESSSIQTIESTDNVSCDHCETDQSIEQLVESKIDQPKIQIKKRANKKVRFDNKLKYWTEEEDNLELESLFEDVKSDRVELSKQIQNVKIDDLDQFVIKSDKIRPKTESSDSETDTESFSDSNTVSEPEPILNKEEYEKAEKQKRSGLEEVAANSLLDLIPIKNHGFTFKIDFIDTNQKPIRCKCRPLPWNLKDKVRHEIENQVKAGIIRPSKSPWCFPIRVVEKPNGEIRITVDYKELNKVIKDDNQPLPSINDLYNMMTDADAFTKMDLKSAYHQIPSHEDSIEVTAFICEFGVFEYVYMTMEKSVPLANQIELLGNVISKNQIRPNPNRAKCLELKPRPVTVKELQSWLGVANYYRRFIKKYAQLTKPLYDLMDLKNTPSKFRKKNGAVNGKKVLLSWNKKAEKRFLKLKKILCCKLVLTLPNFNEKMILTTDACEYGYGAVLEQVVDGCNRQIAYFSRNYTAAQKNYSTTEKELLAVVMSIEYFHQYLYGKFFTVNTDHLPLTWIKKKKDTHPRLERWLLRLSLYNLEIIYKPGKENVVADMLSRLPDENLEKSEKLDFHDNLKAPITEQIPMSTCNESDESQNLVKNIENVGVGDDGSELVQIEQNVENLDKSSVNLLQEQDGDEDLMWIKDLIKQHGEKKPKVLIFENVIRENCFDNMIIYI